MRTVSCDAAFRGDRCAPALECLERRTHLSAGDLDASFGQGGLAVYRHLGAAGSMTTQRRGDGTLRVLVADGTGVERFTLDGRLDPTFGDGGRVAIATRHRRWTIFDVAVQPDAGVLVSGVYTLGGQGAPAVTFVERLTKDGLPDATFGSNGDGVVSVTGVPGHDFVLGREALAVQADGKIIVGGSDQDPGDRYPESPEVIRLNPDGSPDASFGQGGVATQPARWVSELATFLRPDGSVAMIGGNGVIDFLGTVSVAFAPDGTPEADPHLSVPGDMGSLLTATAQRGPGGPILVAGEGDYYGGGRQYNLTLQIGEGTPAVPFGFNSSVQGGPSALAFAADGKLWAAASDGANVAVERLTSSGSPDATFGEGGTATLRVGGAVTAALGLADGSLLLAGSSSRGRMLLMRVQGGTVTPTQTAPHVVALSDTSSNLAELLPEYRYHRVGLAVTFAAARPVDASTFDDGDILVTGPNGYHARGMFGVVIEHSPAGRTVLTPTYSVAAPGGSWDATDDGTYTVRLLPNQVFDVEGQAAAAGVVGRFTVAI